MKLPMPSVIILAILCIQVFSFVKLVSKKKKKKSQKLN